MLDNIVMFGFQKGFASALVILGVLLILVLGVGGYYLFINHKTSGYESKSEKPIESPYFESDDLGSLKEESKYIKNNEVQLSCVVVKTHQGASAFTLEIYMPNPDNIPVKATILDGGKELKELNLEGPYDSITSPGDKVYNATIQASPNYESKEVKVQIKDGQQVSFISKRLGSCSGGIE